MAAVDRYGCSTLVVVPTMLQRIMELGEQELSGYDLDRLRVLFCSGSALSPGLATEAMDRLGDVLYNFYGTTEVAVATVATPEDLRAAPGTVGYSPRNCVVRLYDVDNREVTGANKVGRIHVGSHLRAAVRSGRDEVDGLVDTGDLGHFDEDGRLFIDGREDDMIISGGENVFPSEVEHLLMTHYQVRDAAVVGVPDHQFGQRLRAYVVPTPGVRLDPTELREFVRVSLARHKVPRDVVIVPRLPRTATGKVIRDRLDSPS
jgi:fatty-acyl-CoA synthase